MAVAAGERVFSRGESNDKVFLVRRGRVDILLPLPGGKRHHLATFCRGDFFGELAFLDRGIRSADAEAKTDVDLYMLSRERFDEIARRDAVLAARVFSRIAKVVAFRLRNADAELASLENR